MDGRMIDSIVWFDIHGAVDFHDSDRVAPEKIFCHPEFREIGVSDVNYPSMTNPSVAGQYRHGGILHDWT
jgi:hypothetical protein